MADLDTNPFDKHESRTEEPTDKHIPLDPVTPGGGGWALWAWGRTVTSSTWELELKQETLFRGRESQRNRLLINRVEGLYERLSQKLARTSEVFHYNLFELRDGKLYFRDKSKPLPTKKRGLKSAKEIMKILGKEGLHDLDFHIYKCTVTARKATMLNIVEEEIPSASDVDKAGDIELQEIVKSTEDLIFQNKDIQADTDDLFEHPLRELLGLDAHLRSIRGFLKVEVTKKVQLEEYIVKEHHKLKEF